MRLLLFLSSFFSFISLWIQGSIVEKEQFIPCDIFFRIIEHAVPNFLSSTNLEEVRNNERLLFPYTLVCTTWKKGLDERFDFKKMEELFVDTNGWQRKAFLSHYEKRMRILKKHDYDDTWLTDQNNQIITYEVDTIFNDKSLKQYLDIPFLFSFYFQESMKNELNKFSNEGCQKFLFYIKAGGFLSQSLLECIFKYIYQAADEIVIDLCAHCQYRQCKAFYEVLSCYDPNVFLQKKLSYMLKCKQYITDDAIEPRCKIVIPDDILDYLLFLSSFINDQKTQKKSFFDIDKMKCFFAEYKDIFAKKDKSGRFFSSYLLHILLQDQEYKSIPDLFIAFFKSKERT